MAERIVHDLELIEIEVMDRDRFLAVNPAAQRLFEPLVQQHPVGKIGQRVVVCAMYSILTSDCRCSVMSSWVATQAGPFGHSGRCRILMVRPLRSSTMSVGGFQGDTATLLRHSMYSSFDIAGKHPASKRMSTISVNGVPRGRRRSG